MSTCSKILIAIVLESEVHVRTSQVTVNLASVQQACDFSAEPRNSEIL